MAIFSCNGTISTFDAVLNATYGSLLPFAFIISLLLNPVIFVYNYKQRASVGGLLFQLLAVSDFVTCLYQPLVLIWALWDPEAATRPEDTNNLHVASTILMAGVIFGSGMLTNLLSITRYIKIRYPFVSISRKGVLIFALSNFLLFDGAIATLLLLSHAPYYDVRYQLVWYQIDSWSVCLLSLFGLQSLLATLSSVATVYELRKGDNSLKENTRNKTRTEKIKRRLAAQRRSGFTILIMSVGNMTLVLFGIVYIIIKLWHLDGGVCPQLYNFTVFNFFGFIPIVLSAINPLIVTLRSSGVKGMLVGQWSTGAAGQGDTTAANGRSATVPIRQYLRSVSAPNGHVPVTGLMVVQNFSAMLRSGSTVSVAPVAPAESPHLTRTTSCRK